MHWDAIKDIDDGKYYFTFSDGGAGKCCYHVDPNGQQTTPPRYLASKYILKSLGTRYETCEECQNQNPPPSSSSSAGPAPCSSCCSAVVVQWSAGTFGGRTVVTKHQSIPCYWSVSTSKGSATIQLIGSTWYLNVQGYDNATTIEDDDGVSTSTSGNSGQYCYLQATAPYDPNGHPVIEYDNSSSSTSTAGQPCPAYANWTVTSNSCGGTSGARVSTYCDMPDPMKIYWRARVCCEHSPTGISVFFQSREYRLGLAGYCIWGTAQKGPDERGYPLVSISKGDLNDLEGEDGFPEVGPIGFIYWVIIVRTYDPNGNPDKKYRFMQADQGTGYPCGDKPWVYVDDDNGVETSSIFIINDKGNPWHEIWIHFDPRRPDGSRVKIGNGLGNGYKDLILLYILLDGWCTEVSLKYDPLTGEPEGFNYGDFIADHDTKWRKYDLPWHWKNNDPETNVLVFETNGTDCTCSDPLPSSSSSGQWMATGICTGQLSGSSSSSSSGQLTNEYWIRKEDAPSVTTTFYDPVTDLCQNFNPRGQVYPNKPENARVADELVNGFPTCLDCIGGRLATLCPRELNPDKAQTVWVPDYDGVPTEPTVFFHQKRCYLYDPSKPKVNRLPSYATVDIRNVTKYSDCQKCHCGKPNEDLSVKAIWCGPAGTTDQHVYVRVKNLSHVTEYFYATYNGVGACYAIVPTATRVTMPEGANEYVPVRSGSSSTTAYATCKQCMDDHSSSSSSGQSSSSSEPSSSSSGGATCPWCYVILYSVDGEPAAPDIDFETTESGWQATVNRDGCTDVWVAPPDPENPLCIPTEGWSLASTTCPDSDPQLMVLKEECASSSSSAGDSSSSSGQSSSSSSSAPSSSSSSAGMSSSSSAGLSSSSSSSGDGGTSSSSTGDGGDSSSSSGGGSSSSSGGGSSSSSGGDCIPDPGVCLGFCQCVIPDPDIEGNFTTIEWCCIDSCGRTVAAPAGCDGSTGEGAGDI